MPRFLRFAAVWLVRLAGLGLVAYHLNWIAIPAPAYVFQAFSETLAPARVALPLVTAASFAVLGIVMFRLAPVVGATVLSPRGLLAPLFVALIEQLCAAMLAHESYRHGFGEQLFRGTPRFHEVAGWGPLAVALACLFVLAARSRAVVPAPSTRPAAPRRWPALASSLLGVMGLGCALRTFAELSPEEHVEHLSNIAAMAECFVGARIVELWWGTPPPITAVAIDGPARAPRAPEWVALLLGLDALRLIGRQDVVIGIFSYRYIEVPNEALVFPQGKLWNAAALSIQLALASAAAVVALIAVRHEAEPRAPARPTDVGRGAAWGWRAVRGITLLSTAGLGALAVSAAGAIRLGGEPWLGAVELLGFGATLVGGGLECRDSAGADGPADFPAGHGAALMLAGMLVTALAALVRLSAWMPS